MVASFGQLDQFGMAPAGAGEERHPRPVRTALAVAAVAALVAALFWAGIRLGEGPHSVASHLVGRPAPSFVLPRLDGEGELTSDRLQGSPYIVNFWASWCSACQRENQALRSAYAGWQEQGVALVGVSFDDSAGAARSFRRRHGGAWPLAGDPSGALATAYGVASVPSTFVVSEDGTVLAKHVGAVGVAEIDALLEDARQAAAPAG